MRAGIRSHVRGGAAALVLSGTLLSAGCANAPDHPAARTGGLPGVPDACAMADLPDEDTVMRLPFEIVHGRVYVQAHVNGAGPYTFAIDTGASGLGRADASLTEALGLKISGTAETGDGVTVAAADTVHFDSLDVGGVIKTEFDVMTRDYSSSAPPGAEISGIVGRDFFADGLLVIDFPSRIVSFSQTRALSPAVDGVLAYARPFRVPVVIGDRVFEANLDTGAGVTMVFPRKLFDAVSGGPLESAGQGRLTNTLISMDRGIVHGPVRIGGATVSDIEVRVSEEFPELLVGAEVLQGYVLAFDQRARLVTVCPPGE